MTLDDYLEIWADWMAADDGPGDYPGIACGFRNARTNFHVALEDSNTEADDREYGYAPIVDACIDSMPRHERLAIHHRFGFANAERVIGQDVGAIFLACLPRLSAIVGKRLPLEAASVGAEAHARAPATEHDFRRLSRCNASA